MEVEQTDSKVPCIDTVRALHQTVVALRAALEQSKNEILELKKSSWSKDSVEETLKNLSLENHILRRKLIDSQEKTDLKSIESENLLNENHEKLHDSLEIKQQEVNKVIEVIPVENGNGETENVTRISEEVKQKKVTIISPKLSPKRNLETKITSKLSPKGNLETKIYIRTETTSPRKVSRSLESLTILNTPRNSTGKLTLSKTVSFSNVAKISRDLKIFKDKEMTEETMNEITGLQSPSGDENDEVDDIELIFTTDETKDDDFKEQLVSIDTGDPNMDASNSLRPLGELDMNLELSDRELDDDVFNDNFENENQENSNFQSFDMKRDNSALYNSKSDNSINHDEKSFKSYYSYQDSSFENRSLEKDESFDRFEEKVRIVETDISKCGILDVDYSGLRRNTCPNPIQYRPLVHREALAKNRKSRPILGQSNATRRESGAQTDISALPNSSWRSESSLANKAKLGENFPTLPSKFPLPGTRLRLSEKTVEARRVLLSDIGFTSMVPELSRSADHLCPENMKPPTVTHYGQFLRTTDLYSPAYASQKFTWAATTATPSECSQTPSRYSSTYPLSPPAPSRRCSAPVSPSRRPILKNTPSKVRFANGSLPELRSDWTMGVDSGDSTDSLVEEAENFLRRSIDCFMTGGNLTISSDGKKTVPRRASAPESRDNVPPTGWQPFLPRQPRDLKPDHWVKVITPEGRVRGGRVRYVGPVISQNDQYVGVQLGCPDGSNDGMYLTRRYFQCEPYHGIFVPFKKVIMGWRP